jgi:hypothetical protein
MSAMNAFVYYTATSVNGYIADENSSLQWLFDVGGGDAVETVYIPETDRGTLCVSSQAGCAVGCRFCSTGHQGFSRNLSTAEIVGQLWFAEHRLRARQAAGGSERATGRFIACSITSPSASVPSACARPEPASALHAAVRTRARVAPAGSFSASSSARVRTCM